MRAFHDRVPFVAGSDTSEAAARSIEDLTKSLLGRVFAAIVRYGGMTCDAIEETLNLRHQTASARVRELAKLGKIEDSGKRAKTRSGRAAVVWMERRRTDGRA